MWVSDREGHTPWDRLVAFRDLEDATNEALELFGNKDARGRVLLKPYGESYADCADKIHQFLTDHPPGENTTGKAAQNEFIQLYGAILRLSKTPTSFDELRGNEILSARQGQEYHIHAEYRTEKDAEKEIISDDLVFEIELIKLVEINVEYILILVDQARAHAEDGEDKETRTQISRAVDTSPTLRNKKDLIEAFVASVTVHGAVDAEWEAFIPARRETELADIIATEKLLDAPARAYIDAAFRDGELRTTGTAITTVLRRVSRFAKSGSRADTKRRLIDRLTTFFDRYFTLGGL